MQEVGKSTVARLLATENITVVQDKVSTASFDVKNRVLTLPMWKDDMAPETTDHLIGHEVGHALYTPLDGWHDAVCSKGAGYKSFLNVVEDARIEKLIQRKYPGLRRSFVKSYKALLAEGFFGADIGTINNLPLIDRLNVHFKCGLMSGVKFTDDEKKWLPRIESAETWDEVVAIVDDLYGHAKEELEERQEQMELGDEGDEDMDMEAGESPFDFGDDDYHGEQDGPGTPYGDPDEEDWGDDVGGNMGQHGGRSAQEPKSQTDQILRDSIDREMNTDHQGEVHNLKLARITNSEDYIVTYKDIFEQIDAGQTRLNKTEWFDPSDPYYENVIRRNKDDAQKVQEVGEQLLDRWRKNNQKSVNTLVKEFEMRKSAAEYARASIAKTGVIDTVKMNKYKLTDDIFRKVTVIPEGKNHGFIMYMDMSGSMYDYMFETVEQTIMLAHFCKQIGVPFRVFGFTDALSYGDSNPYKGQASTKNLVTPDCDLRLLELFSERMNKMEMSRMSALLLAQYAAGSKALQKADRDLWYSARYMNQLHIFRLGGTPLNSALSVGIDFANKFRRDHRLDVINTFLLTDGESHGQTIDGTDWGRSIRSMAYTRDSYLTLTSPYTNKTHRLGMKNGVDRMDEYDLMTQIYREATGSAVIGYKIVSNGSRAFSDEMRRQTGDYDFKGERRKVFLKDGYIKLDSTLGHDEMYVISVKSLTPAPNKLDAVDAGASKARLRSAFKASGQNAKKTRKMLIDLAKRVA